MKKITKILTLTLPMISIAPIASLSTHNTNVTTRTTGVKISAGWPEKTHYEAQITDNAWKKKDYLTGKMIADIIEWDSNGHKLHVTLDVASDKSTEHDGGWDSWHSDFEVAYYGDNARLYSKNKKAYLGVDVGFDSDASYFYIMFEVQSAYSWVSSKGECIIK